jgi:hypothetical protein
LHTPEPGHRIGGPVTHTLYRIGRDGTREPVSTHKSLGKGLSAGQAAVHADAETAYALYKGERRLARFGFSRLLAKDPAAFAGLTL